MFAELCIIGIVIAGCVYVALLVSPGLKVSAAKTLSALSIDSTVIDNKIDANLIAFPDATTVAIEEKKVIRGAGYAWNGQSALLAANGGPLTVKGSLMNKRGISMSFVKQDWLSELRKMHLKGVESFHNGQEYPDSEDSALFIVIMGDGVPFYLSTTQEALNKIYGPGVYTLKVVGAVGRSVGEDKLIGPMAWKTNPQAMLGSVISVVPGDGDWVVLVNFCAANNLPINPDFNTYDAAAVNIHASADDDYINSAKELIASELEGLTVERDVVKDGKRTGDKIKVKITGCATWTPGDKIVFDALTGFTDVTSTADFPNQMATTVIFIDQWAKKHPKEVTDILAASYEAANQMKLYDEWRIYASKAVAATFKYETPKYWYDMFQGQKAIKNGIGYSVGGTAVMNYSDAMQYYGITDGVNRYKSVYDQVSTYLVDLNPFDFNSSVSRVIPYEEAVDLTYLKSINDVQSGVVNTFKYSDIKTTVMASGEWNINFATNSSEMLGSSIPDLETIYNLLIQAEASKLTIVGHTDDSGSNDINIPLSNERAQAVASYLRQRGVNPSRFQVVEGKGSSSPLVDNTAAAGKAKNRRVTVTFLQ